MNAITAQVIREFQSESNKLYLRRHVHECLNNKMCHFIKRYETEMMNSDLIIGIPIDEYVEILNTEFLSSNVTNIDTDNSNIVYTVHDGCPKGIDGGPATTRNQSNMSADDMLKSFRRDGSTHGLTVREDNDSSESAYYYGGGVASGITINDQTNINNYVSPYDNIDSHPLNGKRSTPFGVSTPESNARLLSRRTFRSNEHGIENGIPVYEQRLYRRNIERDISETLVGREREGRIYKHDMQSLYDRVDARR